MITSDDVVKVARSAIGTPYHHTGRVAGLTGAIDCIGLLIYIMRTLKIDYDYTAESQMYATNADNIETLIDRIRQSGAATEIEPIDSLQAGDMLILRGKMMFNHCGVYTGDKTFVHAWQTIGRVVEMPYDGYWPKQLYKVFRLKVLTQ